MRLYVREKVKYVIPSKFLPNCWISQKTKYFCDIIKLELNNAIYKKATSLRKESQRADVDQIRCDLS